MADYKKALDKGQYYDDMGKQSDVLFTIEYIRSAVDIILAQHSSTDKKRTIFSHHEKQQ